MIISFDAVCFAVEKCAVRDNDVHSCDLNGNQLRKVSNFEIEKPAFFCKPRTNDHHFRIAICNEIRVASHY
jgi:hypothetical protein